MFRRFLFTEFYELHGSKRLTHLIKNDLQKGTVIDDALHCSRMKTHILDRLPLFLHEKDDACLAVHDRGWLKDDKNFKVRMCTSLTTFKNLSFKSINMTRGKSTFATVEKDGDYDSSAITLWIVQDSSESELYYEYVDSQYSNELC